MSRWCRTIASIRRYVTPIFWTTAPALCAGSRTIFGGDPEKIFLMGHSAGAHIAAMLSIDSTWLDKVGLVPGRDLAGLIGILGAVRLPAAQGRDANYHFRRR